MDAMKVITVIQRSDDKHARGANTNDEATNESYEYASGEEIHVNNPYGNSSESGPKGTKDSDQQQASEADAGPATVQGVPATATAAGPAAVQQPVAAAFGGASAACPQMFDISSGSDDDDDDDESEEPPFAPPEGDYGDETERETMTDLIYRSPSSGPGTPDFGFQEVDTDFVSKAAAHLKAQLSGDQACVRLKEELAEMEAAKATAESAKTTLEERLSEKNEVISHLRRELHKLEERTEALLAEGKQALNQAQQKHREEVKDLRVYKVLYESRDEPVQINVNELNFTE